MPIVVDSSASERSVVPSDPTLAALVMKVVTWVEDALQTEVLPSPEMRGAWCAVVSGTTVIVKAEPIGRGVAVVVPGSPKVAVHWIFKDSDEAPGHLRDFFRTLGLNPA